MRKTPARTRVRQNLLIGKRGAKHRKRSGSQQPTEQDVGGSGTVIPIEVLPVVML